jgi:signal transduction histidine kinase
MDKPKSVTPESSGRSPREPFPFGRRGRLRNQSQVLLALARSENFSAGRLEAALQEITEASASTLSTERVGVWLFEEDRSKLVCVDLYQQSSRDHSSGAELLAEQYPAYFAALSEERTIAAHEAAADPRTREFKESYLETLGIRSMLDVPIRAGGEMLGVVCNEHVGGPRRWSAVEQGFAASIGDFVALAIEASERRKAEDLLKEYSRTLELRVEARTRELKQKNAELMRTLEQLHDTQAQLLIREKLASLGRLVAGIAHEVNNPIGAIISAADLSDKCLSKVLGRMEAAGSIAELQTDDAFQEYVKVLQENNQVIASAAGRISTLVKSMKSFARLDEAELQLADLHEGIDNTLALIEHELLGHVRVVRDYGRLPKVWCYPTQLNQVFFSLFVNASQAMRDSGTLTVKTLTDGDSAVVRVADTGKGIAPQNLSRVFDPGFTTKGVGIGTGFGLSISYSIVQKHGGSMRVTSEPGKGSEFTVVLPVLKDAAVGGVAL